MSVSRSKLNSKQRSGMTRRQFTATGLSGVLGMGLSNIVHGASQSHAADLLPGAAKRCIYLFAWGGPSQIETLDPKPNAPVEVRGEFQPIATATPGILIGENFPRIARHTDKMAIVRSLTHNDPAHLSSGHLALTGHLARVIKSDAEPPSDRDTPHIGSVYGSLRGAPSNLPPFVTLPWYAAHSAAPGGRAPGQTGGWMGRSYDPFLVTGDPSREDWRLSTLELAEGISAKRLGNRQALLNQFEKARWQSAQQDDALSPQFSWNRDQAVELLTSPAVRSAFDIRQEPTPVRERYGMNIHGQSVLLARRLVEHGVPIVSVNWHDDRRNYWDSHGDVANRLKNDLMPPTDLAMSALFEDLEQSGLLSETLVIWVGEFGRKPVINNAAGRDHHPFCYSGLLAGGPIQGGTTYGTSDAHAYYPDSLPVTPQDFISTALLAMGIEEEAAIADPLGRPQRIHAGKPIRDLLV